MDVLETRGLKKLGYESNSKQVRYMYKQSMHRNLFVWNKIHATRSGVPFK